MLIELEPIFCLHTRPYRDTSLLLEAFTRQHGRIGLVARGVKSKKKSGATLLQPFSPLLASWWLRGELGTLRHTELHHQPVWLTGKRLISGLYVNELLNRLLGRYVPHTELFDYYAQLIQQLASVELHEISQCLRLFEKFLVTQLGYGLVFDRDALTGATIVPDRYYVFESTVGCYATAAHATEQSTIPLYKGSSLLALHQENFADATQLQDAKRIMRTVLSTHLGNRPLYSRALWS